MSQMPCKPTHVESTLKVETKRANIYNITQDNS